jgi:rare lipoprotein A
MNRSEHQPSGERHCAAPEPPGERASRRRRIAGRILRLRHDVRLYRRLSAALCALLLLCLAGVGFAGWVESDEAIALGQGVAGVERYDPSVPLHRDTVIVELPEGYVAPAPPKEEPAPGEALVRSLLGEGAASYYHDALEGRSTASGQPYRADGLTAAHRSLPFGSRVRVTNLSNGLSVVVRVNDRGPFTRGRVIDLSRAAAARIGLLARGHGKVRLELVE